MQNYILVILVLWGIYEFILRWAEGILGRRVDDVKNACPESPTPENTKIFFKRVEDFFCELKKICFGIIYSSMKKEIQKIKCPRDGLINVAVKQAREWIEIINNQILKRSIKLVSFEEFKGFGGLTDLQALSLDMHSLNNCQNVLSSEKSVSTLIEVLEEISIAFLHFKEVIKLRGDSVNDLEKETDILLPLIRELKDYKNQIEANLSFSRCDDFLQIEEVVGGNGCFVLRLLIGDFCDGSSRRSKEEVKEVCKKYLNHVERLQNRIKDGIANVSLLSGLVRFFSTKG